MKNALTVKRLFLSLLFLIVILSATTLYFYRSSRQAQNNPGKASQVEAESLVNEIGKLMFLPDGEMPTIATVSDPEKLKGQAFFLGAKVGDKVLIYSNAKKAILYDPIAKKIV